MIWKVWPREKKAAEGRQRHAWRGEREARRPARPSNAPAIAAPTTMDVADMATTTDCGTMALRLIVRS